MTQRNGLWLHEQPVTLDLQVIGSLGKNHPIPSLIALLSQTTRNVQYLIYSSSVFVCWLCVVL